MLKQEQELRRQVVEIISTEELVPREHLLRKIDAAVDFDAIDGAPVDLLFVLLVPEAATDAHLELLRQIASMLDRSEVRASLRQAASSEALYQVVVDTQNQLNRA